MRRIKLLELPGSRPGRRSPAYTRAELLDGLKSFLDEAYPDERLRWDRNAEGQECMVLPSSFQLVRVHRTRGEVVRLVVGGGGKRAAKICVVEKPSDYWDVRWAMAATGRVRDTFWDE